MRRYAANAASSSTIATYGFFVDRPVAPGEEISASIGCTGMGVSIRFHTTFKTRTSTGFAKVVKVRPSSHFEQGFAESSHWGRGRSGDSPRNTPLFVAYHLKSVRCPLTLGFRVRVRGRANDDAEVGDNRRIPRVSGDDGVCVRITVAQRRIGSKPGGVDPARACHIARAAGRSRDGARRFRTDRTGSGRAPLRLVLITPFEAPPASLRRIVRTCRRTLRNQTEGLCPSDTLSCPSHPSGRLPFSDSAGARAHC